MVRFAPSTAMTFVVPCAARWRADASACSTSGSRMLVDICPSWFVPVQSSAGSISGSSRSRLRGIRAPAGALHRRSLNAGAEGGRTDRRALTRAPYFEAGLHAEEVGAVAEPDVLGDGVIGKALDVEAEARAAARLLAVCDVLPGRAPHGDRALPHLPASRRPDGHGARHAAGRLSAASVVRPDHQLEAAIRGDGSRLRTEPDIISGIPLAAGWRGELPHGGDRVNGGELLRRPIPAVKRSRLPPVDDRRVGGGRVPAGAKAPVGKRDREAPASTPREGLNALGRARAVDVVLDGVRSDLTEEILRAADRG